MKVSAEKLGFVKASKYRKVILFALYSEHKTPTEIQKELSLLSEQVARTLKELVDKNLIKCLNPSARKGRLYTLTANGKNLVSNFLKKSK